jgi:hypothetical protein
MGKYPVIPGIKTFRDVKSALDNIRSWFQSDPIQPITVTSVSDKSTGTQNNIKNGYLYVVSLANNGNLTLPLIASGFMAKGNIVVSTFTESADFYIDSSGNVNLYRLALNDITVLDGGGSTGLPATTSKIVANANTTGSISIGDDPAISPVVITNRIGIVVNIVVQLGFI